MRRLEKSIEGSVVKHARARGIEVVKLNGLGKMALPDRMFLAPKGRLLFVEFKREGEEPTPLQATLHKRWAKLGFKVYVIDDVTAGKELVDKLMRMDLRYPLEDR